MKRLYVIGAALAFLLMVGAASANHAPENIRLIRHSAKTVTVGWNAVSGVTGYGLFVDGTRVATAGATATQAKFGTPQYRQYTLGVLALKTGGAMSTITVEPRWVAVSTNVPSEPNPPPTGPTVQITSGPTNPTTSTTATFTWSSTNASSFTCKLDTAAAASCTSPANYSGLSVASHTFVVTASGPGGSAQASSTWAVQSGPPPGGTVTLTPIDGGTSYYSRFTNTAGMDASTYFPLAVWGSYNHTQQNRDLDAAAGLNTYVWAADNSFMSQIRTDGRFKVIQDEGNRANVGTETAGWLLGDEIDMCCGPPGFAGGNGYTMIQNVLNSLPADNRARYANYGKGVLLWESDSDAAKFINGPNGNNSFQQIVSADLYWFTDPNENGNSRKGFGSSYGTDVARMRMLDNMDSVRQPVWAFVETGWPFTESASQGGRAIQPAEMRSAAWHALIAGARGILYFQHSFGGPCVGDHHTTRSNCEGTRPALITLNAQIKGLAPVLNSPFVTSGHSATGDIRYTVKWNGSNFYVFAGANRGGGNATFSVPCVGNATATVLDEGRSVTVSNGSFSDSFADKNAVHLYRIDGGSRCGL